MVCKAPISGDIEQNKTWPNWNEDIEFKATEYFEPDGVTDRLPQLVDFVARATVEGQPLRPIGSGWSFEDIAKSEARVVSLKNLDRQLHYVVGDGGPGLTDTWRAVQVDPNANRRLVHVEAGIRIATLSEMLHSQGLAMPTLGGANGQGLAGVISTSTHGGDWQQPPFPDLVRAVHLVTEGGRELWIERASAPITTDARLKPALPCPDTDILRDDRVFDAVLVGCGRFGVIYSFVLEVRESFNVVEVVTTPTRAEVLQALRDGQANGKLFAPLFDLLSTAPVPAGLDDATGEPYFVQILFNSQNPNNVWVHRRWETARPLGSDVRVVAESSSHDLAVAYVKLANAALLAAIAAAAAFPPFGVVAQLYILGLIVYLNGLIASRRFTLGSVLAAALDALWKVPGAAHAIPGINFQAIDDRFRPVIQSGRRGPHYLITSGSRADSDNIPYKADSIELVFDASTSGYLDFLDDVLAVAPSFQQAGYISLRPSKASKAYLSMHRVTGTHAMSIEISTLKNLPGNLEWMRYVHRAAIQRNGRPHWGQYNKLDELDVAMLYGNLLNEWREALLQVSGVSTLFSNEFCRSRGLEPVAIAREVTAVRKRGRDVITHLCQKGARWSPVTVNQAIREIQSGAVQYYTRLGDRVVPVQVVDDGRGGNYLRSQADATEQNNLDNLPSC